MPKQSQKNEYYKKIIRNRLWYSYMFYVYKFYMETILNCHIRKGYY